MKLRTKIILALAGLAALTGAECGGDPNVPGGKEFPEPPVAEDPIVELYTDVPARCSPYTVSILITGGEGLNPRKSFTVAAGKWVDTVVYKTGKRLTLTLSILEAKKNCHLNTEELKIMGCQIKDGTFGSGLRPLASTGSVVCLHTTRR